MPTMKQQQVSNTTAEVQKIKRKRNVLLDEQSENLLLLQEREEFGKVLQEQFSQVDITRLCTLPECQHDPQLHIHNDDSWEYWMSIMLQYQTYRSYTHYSTEEEKQQKQLEWQKEMRFQLMQKKRAIKREKRKILKLQKKLESKTSSTGKTTTNKRTRTNEDDDEELHLTSKRMRTENNNANSVAYNDHDEDSGDSYEAWSDNEEFFGSVEDLSNFNMDIALPSPFPLAIQTIFA